MGRTTTLKKSNYYVLLMPWVARSDPGSWDSHRDPPPLIGKALLDTILLPATDLSNTVGKHETEYSKKLPLMEILRENNDEALRDYLSREDNKRNDTHYIQFLELIAETVLLVWGNNLQYRTSGYKTFVLSPDECKFALKHYRRMSKRVDKGHEPPVGINLAMKSDQKTKDQIRLLAGSYGEYLNAGSGNRERVCLKIQSRPEFRKAELANIREEYIDYDKYFARLAKKIDEAFGLEVIIPYSFTEEEKAKLIMWCAYLFVDR